MNGMHGALFFKTDSEYTVTHILDYSIPADAAVRCTVTIIDEQGLKRRHTFNSIDDLIRCLRQDEYPTYGGGYCSIRSGEYKPNREITVYIREHDRADNSPFFTVTVIRDNRKAIYF